MQNFINTSSDLICNWRILTSLAFGDHASSTPIAAVGRVINSVLSERDVQLSIAKPPSDRCRGSRLENKVGLNITDDEYVISKLKEREQKQARSRKPGAPKEKTVKSSTTKTTKRYRKTVITSKTANKENKTLNESDIANALRHLHTATEFTQKTFDDAFSDDEI